MNEGLIPAAFPLHYTKFLKKILRTKIKWHRELGGYTRIFVL